MTPELTLGFMPLNDCAALAVAERQGFFAAEGLSVRLSREASWATIRDKLAVGALQGGHMLGPMALAASLGLSGEPKPLIAPLALNANGSAITASRPLADALRRLDPDGAEARTARPLARHLAARRELGSAPLTFAVVFPFSMHAYALRYWLADAGIDPDRDVRLVTSPPSRMAEQLRAGLIDGFCAGAPWNALAVLDGVGEILAYGSDVWRDGPDKVLGVEERWAAAEPEALQALIRALLHAARWADAPENRDALLALLARPEYVGAPAEAIGRSVGPAPHQVAFHRGGANAPRIGHALWFLSQMLRWGQLGADVELQGAARRVYRPDLLAPAAEALGIDLPAAPAVETGFCDGRPFDPADPAGYAAGFAITRAR